MTFQKHWLLSMLLIVLLTLSAFSQSQELLGHWGFNNDGTDYSGNEHDAVLQGNADYSEEALGGSHSLLLNGTSAYAAVGAIELGDQFTICAWTFLEPGVSNIQTIIGNAMGGSTVDGFKLFINNWETNNKRIIIETADGSTRLDATSGENVYEEGFWNHVAVTIDKIEGVAGIYYNGEDVTENAPIISGMQVSDPITIGSMTGPDWFWAGMIDDVRIYQGLLSPEDIADVLSSPETSVAIKTDKILPENYHLVNHPNPFNASTTITFTLWQDENIRLDVFNMHGDIVRTLINQVYNAGAHSVRWDGADDSGFPVGSGLYYAKLTGNDHKAINKMLLVK